MIPQARAHIKAHSKQIEQLFRTHSVHGRVFAPWGVYGRTYVVTEKAEYQKISDSYVPIFGLVFLFVLALGAIVDLDKIFYLTLINLCAIVFGFATLFIIIYAHKTVNIIRRLTIAEMRPSFLMALRLHACEQELWRLWFASIICSAGSWALWIITRLARGDQRLVLWPLMLLCALFALTHSLMIFLRGSVASRKA